MPEKLTIDHEVELTRLQVQLSKDYLDSDASKKLLNEIDINGSSWSIGSTHRQTSPSSSSAWDFPGR